MLESLSQAARPADVGADSSLGFSNPKEKLLRVLGQKPRTRLKILRLPKFSRLDCHRWSDPIAVACFSAQAECDRGIKVLHRVAQDPELWRVSVFEDDFQPPVVVQVGEYKRATVVRKVQSDRAGDFRKRPVVVIHVENISVATAPGRVRSDQLIDGAPSLLVVQ